ncbi:MAG: hypothetical protein MZV70_65260 [Desulfobacterales bacterium]|nr:hypothetical protein [Desulfobacterales bacterium]
MRRLIIMVCGKKDVWDMPLRHLGGDREHAADDHGAGPGGLLGDRRSASTSAMRSERRSCWACLKGSRAVSLISIGHMTRPHRQRPRIPINQLVYSETWGEPYYKENV